MATLRMQSATCCVATQRRLSLPCSVARPCQRGFRAVTHSTGAPAADAASVSDRITYTHLLLPILDANPFLSDGSRTAVATAAMYAKQFHSKLTVLIVDEPGTDRTDPAKRIESITWHLKERGCTSFELVEKATKSASVLVGDMADELAADMVLLSSEAVHAKHVDANQLAEFVSCPVMLLP